MYPAPRLSGGRGLLVPPPPQLCHLAASSQTTAALRNGTSTERGVSARLQSWEHAGLRGKRAGRAELAARQAAGITGRGITTPPVTSRLRLSRPPAQSSHRRKVHGPPAVRLILLKDRVTKSAPRRPPHNHTSTRNNVLSPGSRTQTRCPRVVDGAIMAEATDRNMSFNRPPDSHIAQTKCVKTASMRTWLFQQ